MDDESNVLVKIRKTGEKIKNECYYQDNKYTAQGVSIINNTIFRLYNSGICQVYQANDIEDPVLISTFELGSRSSSNHCNCAQFFKNPDGTKLLYISGLNGRCYVERMTHYSSVLIQTIEVPKLDLLFNSQMVNTICGDDGFLWLFGESRENQTLVFAKARRPDIKEKAVSLSIDDIVDYWYETDYVYNQSVWQGGMVYGGYLIFVFGLETDNKHIAVYDTCSHSKVADISLNGVVLEEPEDCDFINGQILLSTNGGRGYYLLNLKTIVPELIFTQE
jgi:hypothetical protein